MFILEKVVNSYNSCYTVLQCIQHRTHSLLLTCIVYFCLNMYMYLSVSCVCVCVRERESVCV